MFKCLIKFKIRILRDYLFAQLTMFANILSISVSESLSICIYIRIYGVFKLCIAVENVKHIIRSTKSMRNFQ